jgi:hypothetical protein
MQGKAAVAIWCDVSPEVRDEFDDWHAHEHMPERLSIPGFRRGSRWVADEGAGYCMLYEALDEATITTGPYLERLNAPTPWSRKMMPHHRNMVRSLCRVEAACGAGVGQSLLTVRYSPHPAKADALQGWLARELLPVLSTRKGLVAAHLLRSIAPASTAQTTEQMLRGGDASADCAILVMGYRAGAVAAVAETDLTEAALVAHGAKPGVVAATYRLAYVLAEDK